MQRILTLTLGLFVVTAGLDLRAAQARPGQLAGSVSGIVLDAGPSPRPLRPVSVQLVDIESGLGSALINESDGRFTFENVSPGRYRLVASKPGYVSMAFGARQYDRPGTVISLVAGQRLTNLSISLPRGAVIAGTVFGPDGTPAASSNVRVQTWEPSGELRVPDAARRMGGLVNTLTDDQGVYRLYGLPAGDYAVSATNRRLGVVGEVFSPGSISRTGAARIRLEAGQERIGVDVQLATVGRAAIKGRVETGGTSTAASVQILSGGPGRSVQTKNGLFEFADLAAGEYVLLARSIGSAGSPMWGRTTVTLVGADASAIIPLVTASTVSGRLDVDAASVDKPDFTRVEVALKPDWLRSSADILRAEVSRDGTFTIYGVVPGRYLLLASAAGMGAGWAVMMAAVQGVDPLDEDIEVQAGEHLTGVKVVLTRQSQSIVGRLTDEQGDPVAHAAIVVFPSNAKLWRRGARRVASTQPDTSGAFSIVGLPAGDYRIAVVVDMAPDELEQRSFFEQMMAQSLAMTLPAGRDVRQDFRLARLVLPPSGVEDPTRRP